MDSIRLYRLAAIAAFSLSLAACAGNGGAIPQGTPIVPAAPAAQPATSTMSVISYNNTTNSLTVQGNVVAFVKGGVQIQGGPGLGYFNIYTTSSTSISGPALFVGEVITATGTGTPSTSMNATSISQVAPSPAPSSSPSGPSVTGPIVAMKTGGFQVQGPKGVGYINIWTNSSTVFTGTKPFVGETVTATGTGSLTTSITATSVTQVASGTVTSASTPAPKPTATAAPTPVASVAPTPAPAQTTAPSGPPPTTSFMPSSWGKISAMQVFDDTANGYVTQAAASADGYRYSSVWGARNNIGTSWLNSNPQLQTSYYNALETDESPTGWGSIGHPLSWWQTNHPDWVLYACKSDNSVTTTPSWVPGLPNVPLDIHNPAVIDYQIHLMANYAHQLGYHALAIDEATFWQADAGAGSGSYGCGIYQNGSFVRRYTGTTDPNWTADVIAWVQRAHTLLTTDPTLSTYHLKLLVNHPASQVNANEQAFLANVDADLNEDGDTFFGNYVKGSAAYLTRSINWTVYAQKHGVAVMTDDNWGKNAVGPAQLDWSMATYLLGNEQAQSLYVASSTGFGLEQWHNEYNTNFGAPCGEYYSANDGANPSIYYRRYQNAIVVVNGGSGSNSEIANLPAGHTYKDLEGRPVTNPLTISSNDGYVLMTSNGCQ